MDITVLRRFKNSVFVKFKPTDNVWYVENLTPEPMRLSYECKNLREAGMIIHTGETYTNYSIITQYIRSVRLGTLKFGWLTDNDAEHTLYLDLDDPS